MAGQQQQQRWRLWCNGGGVRTCVCGTTRELWMCSRSIMQPCKRGRSCSLRPRMAALGFRHEIGQRRRCGSEVNWALDVNKDVQHDLHLRALKGGRQFTCTARPINRTTDWMIDRSSLSTHVHTHTKVARLRAVVERVLRVGWSTSSVQLRNRSHVGERRSQ